MYHIGLEPWIFPHSDRNDWLRNIDRNTWPTLLNDPVEAMTADSPTVRRQVVVVCRIFLCWCNWRCWLIVVGRRRRCAKCNSGRGCNCAVMQNHCQDNKWFCEIIATVVQSRVRRWIYTCDSALWWIVRPTQDFQDPNHKSTYVITTYQYIEIVQ